MIPFDPNLNRRGFLRGGMTLGAFAFTVPGLFAEELSKTPRVTEGPFYPDKLSLDTDNDLILINDKLTHAVGEITHLTGKILDVDGKPIKNATIEIWQVDAKAVYLHTRDSGGKAAQQDKNFQGFGRFTTGSTGEYYFRTIKPVPYPGRAPHIHVKVKMGGKEVHTTQILVAGNSQNKTDGVFRSAGGLLEQELLLAEFKPIKESKLGELSASFNIVLGRTPADKD